jgi:hypothetical protein
MKTAMQELIDELNNIRRNTPYTENWVQSFYKSIIGKASLKIEKEKEQIIDAYCDGAKGGANGTKGQHEFGWVSRHTRNKYYNEKYNQNK